MAKLPDIGLGKAGREIVWLFILGGALAGLAVGSLLGAFATWLVLR